MRSSTVSRADSRLSLLCWEGEAVCELFQPVCDAFQHLGLGVAQLDLDGKWLTVNTRLCEIVGVSRNELLATSFDEVFVSPDSQADADLRHRLLAGNIPSYSIEKRATRKDGAVA